jgi:predicted dehydrogenase
MAYRGALIGCGYISKRHLSAWKQVREAEIVAVCDLDFSKARERAQEFGIGTAFTEIERMLDETDLDFVDIATRPRNHLALVTAFASRGLHVLCQKPMAPSMAEAEQMVRECEQAGVVLMVNENTRHQAWFRKIWGLVNGGALGVVHYARFENRWRATLPKPEFEGQDYFRLMPQLILYEFGVHYLDTARYLFGEARSIFAHLRRISPDIVGEDLAVVAVDFGDLLCLLDLNWYSVPEPAVERIASGRARVEGTEGTVVLEMDGSLTLYRERDQQVWDFPAETIPRSFVAAQKHFVDSLRTGQSPETSGVETLKTMELVFAGYQSAKEGCPIALGESGGNAAREGDNQTSGVSQPQSGKTSF